MRSMASRMRRLAPLACVLALGGCYSKATAYGGKLTFAYASGVEIENFVKPIAPGAKLEILAMPNDGEDPLVISGAKSSRPEVVAVDATRERSVILKAGEPGIAEIELTARDAAGNVLVDKMFFHVAKPAKHALEHACTQAEEAAYVRGDAIDLFHRLATADGRPVIGYAYAPMRIEPAGAIELVAQPQSFPMYRFRAKAKSARVTVRSTIDDKALVMRIVEWGDLTSASLDYADRMLAGGSAYAVARVRSDGAPLCTQTALTKARSLTPEICKVTARLDDDPDGADANREQLAVIDALTFGVCKFEVTLPELAGGRGVVLAGQTNVGRVEFPGEKRARASLWTRVREQLTGWPSVAKDALALAAIVVIAAARGRRGGRSSPRA